MKNIILIITLLTSFNLFSQKNLDKKIIFIVPLGNVNQEYLQTIKNCLENFYKYKCDIKPKVNLTDDILAGSKTRYEASKILEKFNSKNNTIIITEKDIACKDGKYPEWGIFGLGDFPGTTCVVSTFRLKRNTNDSLLKERLKKVVVHEVGHNLGLDHCFNDKQCLMNDAGGTIKQVDREKIWICEKCLKQIKK